MEGLKIKEVEEFINNVEKGIEQIEESIKQLRGLNGRNSTIYALPIKILEKEKQLGEEELKNFREKELSQVIGGINTDRLTGYRDIIISQE